MNIDLEQIKISKKDFSKILFIYKAIEDGWNVRKNNEKYIFCKHISKEKHVYDENFLQNFVQKYFVIEK